MLTELLPSTPTSGRTSVPTSEIDYWLTAQIVVAWAGERGEEGGERRLGWWRSQVLAEYGGVHLFQSLTPKTSAWAVVQAVREVAQRADAALRANEHDPDRLVSLYSLGFGMDERLDERLQHLKRSGIPPGQALPSLDGLINTGWNPGTFAAWAGSFGPVEFEAVPVGRRLKATQPSTLAQTVNALLAALVPLPSRYPMPHYRLPA
jgi:hypothetical protein